MSDDEVVAAAADKINARLHDYTVDYAALDEDNTPTSAWSVGERLDQDTIDRLERIARGDA